MALTGLEIAEYTETLFDVSGISPLPEGGSVILCGLESTPDRDLDEFSRVDGRFELIGFQRHFVPGLEKMLQFLRERGCRAELAGRYGYPLHGRLNLKELAISLGLGVRGKSTVVLHPEYGARLRFAAIFVDGQFDEAKPEAIPDYQPCRNCRVCIDECPVQILEPYKLNDIEKCLSNTKVMKLRNGRLVPCDICLKKCPANNPEG